LRRVGLDRPGHPDRNRPARPPRSGPQPRL